MIELLITYYTFAIKLVVSMVAAIVFLRYFNTKRRLKQETPLGLVINFVLSAIISSFILSDNISITEFIGIMVIYSLFVYIVNLVIFNTTVGRNFFIGRSQILIEHGEFDVEKIRKLKIGAVDLATALRQQDINSISDVQSARLEPSGDVTVVKKGEENNSLILIDNGMIVKDSLARINKSPSWLHKQLRSHGIKDISNVFIAQWGRDGLDIITMG